MTLVCPYPPNAFSGADALLWLEDEVEPGFLVIPDDLFDLLEIQGAELGILGAVTGIIGNMQALETIKILTGLFGKPGSMILF